MHVAYSDGGTPAVYYTYDADGNRLSMTDGTGQSMYTYDVLGRLTHAVNGHGQTMGYGYDLAGQQTRVTYPNGYSVVRAFDDDGRLASVSDWLGNTTGFGYDADGDQISTTFPASTGETDVFAFDAVGAVSSVGINNGSGVLASLAYTRDADGQVTGTSTVGLPGAGSETEVYDQNSRLTQSGVSGYGYDAADNPTQVGSNTNTFDAAGELTGGGGVSYGYDRLGERTLATPSGGPATSYGYDQAGNLTSVSRPAGTGVAAVSDTYAFDGDGLRASQSIGGSSSYLAWDKSAGLPLLLDDGQNSYIYGPGGIPFEQIDGAGNVLFLHHDQQGSTRMLTSTTGAIQATFSYDAYGNPTGSTGTASTPLGYDGQYTDKDTRLIYLRARLYDPATTQFLSVDPLVGSTRAAYDYTNANPIDGSDPTGLCNTNPLSPSFWTSGNCLAGAVGGPNGGGSQPILWDIPAYGAVVVPCVFGGEELCGGAAAAAGAASFAGSDTGSLSCAGGAVYPNYDDPSQPPGPGWEWRGTGPPGSRQGSWYNPSTNQSVHPDLNHDPPKGPHYDYYPPQGGKEPLFPGEPIPDV